MATIPAKPRCKHCGSDEDMPLLHSGKHGTVCARCRREPVQRNRRYLFGVHDGRQPLPAPKRKESYSEHRAKVQRAIERSAREKIPMVDALKMEGVIR